MAVVHDDPDSRVARHPKSPARSVALVDPDEHTSALLCRYLESRGWSVHVDDARSAVRRWGTAIDAPFAVVSFAEDDPDAFELVACLAAGAIGTRVVACAPDSLRHALSQREVDALGIARILGPRPRFSEIAEALEALVGEERRPDEAAACQALDAARTP